MARIFRLLTAVVLSAGGAGAGHGQAPVDPKPIPDHAPGTRSGAGSREARLGVGSPEFENARKALEALTPEQRRHFQDNFRRWSNLPPEQKGALRDRDTFRRKRMAEDIEATIKEAGLELDPARKELFVRRYGEERRKIEEHLRREMDEKRKPLVREMTTKLAAEFATAPVAPVVPAPGTPSPARTP